MPSNTPLTDAINALTTYANETTGASDTTLSDAVGTLVAGYGGGGSEWLFYSGESSTWNGTRWSSIPLSNTLLSGGCVETEMMIVAATNNPNILSVGKDYGSLTAWNTNNAMHIMLNPDGKIYIRQSSATTELTDVTDFTVPHTFKVDKDYIYVDGVPYVATASNIVNSSVIYIGGNDFTGAFNYIRYK